MAERVTFDYSIAKKFISDEEIKMIERNVLNARDELVGKNGDLQYS